VRRNNFTELLYFVFRKDIGRKLMALVLALILWVWLDQKVVTREPHNLTVRVVYGANAFMEQSASFSGEAFFIELPENLILEEDLVDRILQVTLSAPKDILKSRLIGHRKINESDMQGRDTLKIPIKLSKEYFEALRMERAKSVLVDFDPPQIVVEIARRKTVEIELTRENVAFEGLEDLIAKGIEIETVTFDPNTIKIEGPAPVIDEIASDNIRLQLESMALSDIDKRQDLGLSRTMRDKKVSILGSNQSVKVSVNLTEPKDERILEKEVLVLYRGTPLKPEQLARIELVPSSVKVRFSGPRSMIGILPPDDILKTRVLAMVDLAETTVTGAATLDEIIEKNPGITNVEIMRRTLIRPEIHIEPVDRTIQVNKRE
jgi:hypothetical protein